MQHAILPPQKIVYTESSLGVGKVEVQGCHPGYGTTLANSLRRVLLSSLPGAAVTAVKIRGVQHEFSAISGVMEDVVQIILHLKRVRFRFHGDEPVTVSLKGKGEKVLTAGDIKATSSVEVTNPDQIIATLTDKKSSLDMELEIQSGIGYVPVEQQDRLVKEIGTIAVDAIYSPVQRVNFTVENMRVGKQTDYERITFDIETDGSISPEEAFRRSAAILKEQFIVLSGEDVDEVSSKEDSVVDKDEENSGTKKKTVKKTSKKKSEK